MDDPFRRPSLIAAVFYKDPWAALDWLENAFGFERSMVITDKDGRLGHSEMRFGDSILGVGSEWADFVASPASVGGKNTQMMHVKLSEGIDAHCAPAAAARAQWASICCGKSLGGQASWRKPSGSTRRP